MNEGSIFTNITNKVATITFFHPAGNSLPGELLQKLVASFERLGENEAVQVIILKSEGEKSFCAGASFDELLQVSNPEEGKKFFSGFANLINAMRKCPKLIIGRIQGKTVGGGLGIIAATDYCFATEAADIKLSELGIGLGPFVIAPAIERKAGISALSELSLDAKNWRNAYWAQKKGLFNHVYENARDMDAQIEILANTIATYHPEALLEMKKVLWENTGHWDVLLLERAAISGSLALSEFTKKALTDFKK